MAYLKKKMPKVVPFTHSSGAKRKAGHPQRRWEEVIRKDLKGNGTSWEAVKSKALNKLEWKRSVHNSVCHMRLVAEVSGY